MLKKFYGNKKDKENIIVSFVFAILILIIISFLIISNWRISKRREELIQRIESLKTEIAILEERNVELKEGVSDSSDPEYVEKVLREKGLYKKEGEEMVVIVSPEEEEEENKEEEKGIWEKILGKINLRD